MKPKSTKRQKYQDAHLPLIIECRLRPPDGLKTKETNIHKEILFEGYRALKAALTYSVFV